MYYVVFWGLAQGESSLQEQKARLYERTGAICLTSFNASDTVFQGGDRKHPTKHFHFFCLSVGGATSDVGG